MAKQTYRICNWSDYNQSLVSRGSLTVWLDEKTIKHMGMHHRVKENVGALSVMQASPLAAP